jgi:hypothetical protein
MIMTTYRCENRRNYAKTIDRMLDQALHLRW